VIIKDVEVILARLLLLLVVIVVKRLPLFLLLKEICVLLLLSVVRVPRLPIVNLGRFKVYVIFSKQRLERIRFLVFLVMPRNFMDTLRFRTEDLRFSWKV